MANGIILELVIKEPGGRIFSKRDLAIDSWILLLTIWGQMPVLDGNLHTEEAFCVDFLVRYAVDSVVTRALNESGARVDQLYLDVDLPIIPSGISTQLDVRGDGGISVFT